MEAREGFRIFTYMRRRERKTWNFKKYNLSFQYEGKTWEVIHKTTELLYAVELSKKGIAQGAVLKFPVKDLVTTK